MMRDDADLEDLIAGYFEASLDRDSLAQLEKALSTDPAILDLYIDYAVEHHLLNEILNAPTLSSLPGRRPSTASRIAMRRAVNIAAACLALALVGLGFWKSKTREDNSSLRFREASIWHYGPGEDGGDTNSSSGLVQGRILYLQEGSLEAELPSGTRAVIEGPATICLEGKNTLRLDHGRGRFYVPKRARGFTVNTGEFQIEDLGTDFGLLRPAAGDPTEVHLFEGAVLVSSTGEDYRRELEAGQAISLVEGKASAKTIPIDESKFRNTLPQNIEIIFSDNFETYRMPDDSYIPDSPPVRWKKIGEGKIGTFNPGSHRRSYSHPQLTDTSSSRGVIGAMKGPTLVSIEHASPGAGVEIDLGEITGGSSYSTTVAIGHRPQLNFGGAPPSFGGYTIALISGDQVLASISDDRPPGETDSVAYVHLRWDSSNLPPEISIGDPFKIRITTHREASYLDFDNVRVIRSALKPEKNSH